MNRIKITKALALTLIYVFPVFLFGQEDDAAAASSTGSAAAPAKGAPKAAQANTQLRTLHVAIHKLGLTATEILAAGSLDDLHAQYKDALKGGGFQAFSDHGKNMVKHGATLDEAIEHGDLLDDGYSLQDSKDHGDLIRSGHSLEDSKLYGDLIRLGITKEIWDEYNELFLASGLSIDQLILLVQGGISFIDILNNEDSLISALNDGLTIDNFTELFSSDVSLEDILNNSAAIQTAFESGQTLDEVISSVLPDPVDDDLVDDGSGLDDGTDPVLDDGSGSDDGTDPVVPPVVVVDDLSLANEAVISNYATGYEYNEALEAAMTVATTLLTDSTITDALPALSVSVGSLTDGYNLELIRLLSAYGAIGGNGENVASAVLGSDYSGYAAGGTLSSLIQNSSADYLSFLSTLTGSRGFSEEDASSSVLDVSLDKITLIPGSTITLGTSGVDSTIDVSSKLTPAISSDDRKVLILGAAKDLTVAGNVKFTNPNDVEDHALVIGAADDVIVSGANIEYTGSNLAIGAGGSDADSMYLVNTSITTGGNLAAGSLGNLNITNANFNVGMANSASSDPDNVYLYANDILNVNNLSFSGRVDDIYMESKTIHIKNTTFPATSEVMLRSQTGALNVNNSVAPSVVGAVNFHNVTHLGISNSVLERSHFDGADGHINSTVGLPNGTPFIRVRAQ